MISILTLLPLYALGIQYERGGWWRVFAVFALVGLVLDVALNYTELAILTLDFPKWGEWTFSKRLSRLQHNEGWRGALARPIVLLLNSTAPSGQHVKN